MESMIVYLGSDHVIHRPKFGVLTPSIRVETDHAAGVDQACAGDAAGVLNTYQLDLEPLRVICHAQKTSAGIQEADVLICDEADRSFIRIQSEKALKQLTFLGANFVSKQS